MIELLLFYKLSFLVALISASSLPIMGHHQQVRGKVLEIFALSQFALMGNLISKLFFHSHESNVESLIFSYLAFSLGKLFLTQLDIKKEIYGSYMVGIYLCMMAIQYLLIGFFPQLDSHMSTGFFGSMVTSSFSENIVLIAIFLLFLGIHQFYKIEVSRRSLEINIFKKSSNSTFDLFLFSIPLVASLYGLGFLYTLSFLLLPNLILGSSFKNQKQFFIVISILASIAATCGLFFSIAFENISTSSAQIILLFLICSVFKLFLSRSTIH